jgi:hypothetical protein
MQGLLVPEPAPDHAGEGLEPIGTIATPGPFGLGTPCEDVLRVVGVLRKVGIERVRFEANFLPILDAKRPPPLPR